MNTKRNPVILITSFLKDMPHEGDVEHLCVKHPYVENLQSCGATVLIVPLGTKAGDLEYLTEMADGLLIPGGKDIHPMHYGAEDIHEKSGPFAHYRDEMEIALGKFFVARGKPVFGICRGAQILNVALGGTLYQDISSETGTVIHHDRPHLSKIERYEQDIHEVNFLPNTALQSFFGCEKIITNSVHHQAVKNAAPGLCVSAISEDGIVEGIESADMGEKWILGIQWHPEVNVRTHPEQAVLFEKFVEAARERAKQHSV
ncbi:MAG: gamma-glutamyl-gamma-aminobutyrate hydrolase family protein [Parcubacteria group bacterium]|nr:gamma-glutamyl-gamma-aminobutyrate hydrolase family protein [Parcubacteria group bacterium]